MLQKYSWFQTKTIILIKKGTKKHTWFQTTAWVAAVFIFSPVPWLLSCFIAKLHISRLTLTWQSLDNTVHRKRECRWESGPRKPWEIRHFSSKTPITDSLANLRGSMLKAEGEGKTQPRTRAAHTCLECDTQTKWGNASSVGFPGGSDSKESACKAGDLGSVPGSGRFPGEGKSNSSLLA